MAKTFPVRRRSFGAPMTPMIDVIFLLLVFFICTASFQPLEEDLAASLAHEGVVSAATSSPPKPELPMVWIRVASAGESGCRWRVGETPCDSLDAVRQTLTAEPTESITVIAPARDVACGDVLAVYDLCRLLRRSNIRFATGM
ncbi:MAG: ExbD/TolR family protein [Thermoguttaceae bacterium]